MTARVNIDNFSIGPRSRTWMWTLKRRHPVAFLKNRYQWYAYPKKNKVPHFPLHIDFEASSACNLSCPMCWRFKPGYDETKLGNMTFELFKKGVDECVKHNLYSIRLSWRGECTVNPKLADMIAYAKRKGISEVSFITNGYKLEGDFAKEVVMAGVDNITISVDGLYEEYDRVRSPITFEGIVKRIKNLRHLRDTIGKGYPRIRINSVWNEEKGMDWFKRVYDFFGPLVDYMTFTPEYKHECTAKELRPNFVCQYPFQRITIIWDGTMPLCVADKKPDYIIGNLNNDNIYDVWHGDKMNHVRQRHMEHKAGEIEPCSICDRSVTKQVGNQKVGKL